MSMYILLLVINLPFVVLAITGIITRYKMKRITKKRAFIQLSIWLLVLLGLIVARPLYYWLFSRELTVSDAMSLFDVVQLTAIVFLLYVANGHSNKIEQTEKRLNDLHQELSIRLSSKK